jgi:putative ABC transport system permease protein
VGIGVNTAVFSVINTVVLKPLTYPHPQEMMAMMNTLPWGMMHGANVPKFNLWRQQKRIFAQLAAYDDGAGSA